MSSSGDKVLEKIAEKIPDVWFDWYARLLPGCFGAAVYIYLSDNVPAQPTGTQLFLFVIVGYVVGHALQPLVGYIVKSAEMLIFNNEEKYGNAKKDPNVKQSSLNKVSKAHAEANSMLAFAFALGVNTFIFWSSEKINQILAIVLVAYFSVAALERVHARNRKIVDL